MIKITKIIWGIICLFYVLLMSDDFYTALKTPEIYHLGGEELIADGWLYEPQKLYLTDCAISIIWFLIGLMLCLFQHKMEKLKYGIAIHIIMTFIFAILQ